MDRILWQYLIQRDKLNHMEIPSIMSVISSKYYATGRLFNQYRYCSREVLKFMVNSLIVWTASTLLSLIGLII